MLNRKLPVGFIVPAQPVERDKPPAGAGWVHEIKHDGYRLIVRRDGTVVRLWTRNAVDYTNQMPTIATRQSRPLQDRGRLCLAAGFRAVVWAMRAIAPTVEAPGRRHL
jgi:ATP-dependent DNA ligase